MDSEAWKTIKCNREHVRDKANKETRLKSGGWGEKAVSLVTRGASGVGRDAVWGVWEEARGTCSFLGKSWLPRGKRIQNEKIMLKLFQGSSFGVQNIYISLISPEPY